MSTITTYEYSKLVNGDKLMWEVHDSSIITCMVGVQTVGSVSFITFKDQLSAGDKTTLDALVAAHDPTETPDQEIKKTSFVENENCTHLDLTYKMVPHLFTIPATAGKHEFEISFPWDIMLLGGTVEVSSANLGDSVQFETLADTVVGQLTAACEEGDTTINVNIEAATNYIWRAYDLDAVTLDQYGQIVTSTPLGRVKSKAGTEVTLTAALTAQQEFAAGTYVSAEYVAIEKYKLLREQTIWISRDTDRGALIPANTKMRFYYWNDITPTVTKEIQIVLELYV